MKLPLAVCLPADDVLKAPGLGLSSYEALLDRDTYRCREDSLLLTREVESSLARIVHHSFPGYLEGSVLSRHIQKELEVSPTCLFVVCSIAPQ